LQQQISIHQRNNANSVQKPTDDILTLTMQTKQNMCYYLLLTGRIRRLRISWQNREICSKLAP